MAAQRNSELVEMTAFPARFSKRTNRCEPDVRSEVHECASRSSVNGFTGPSAVDGDGDRMPIPSRVTEGYAYEEHSNELGSGSWQVDGDEG